MFHYFFMRKLWFAQLAKALIVFPGGFGTMDELWEMLTLMQTGKLQRRNLILIYGRKYWDRVLDWKHMLRCGTINQHEYGLLEFADTVDQAFRARARRPRKASFGAGFAAAVARRSSREKENPRPPRRTGYPNLLSQTAGSICRLNALTARGAVPARRPQT